MIDIKQFQIGYIKQLVENGELQVADGLKERILYDKLNDVELAALQELAEKMGATSDLLAERGERLW